MTSLLNLKYFLDPSHNLMRGRVRRLVKIDDSIVLQHVNRSSNWRISIGKRSKMIRLHMKFIVVLKINVGLPLRVEAIMMFQEGVPSD